jgi:hypothetical protein
LKLVLTLLVLVAACSNCGTGPQPVPSPAVDAGPPDAPTAADVVQAPSCATACTRAAALDCPWGTPSPDGVSCEAVCLNAQKLLTWDLKCRTTAPTCAAQAACQ